jgi:hypothetical protein
MNNQEQILALVEEFGITEAEAKQLVEEGIAPKGTMAAYGSFDPTHGSSCAWNDHGYDSAN